MIHTRCLPRLDSSLFRRTVDFVKAVEASRVDYITVHGRSRAQKSREPANLDAIKLIKESARVPVVANGDAFNLHDVQRTAAYTGADGSVLAL